MRRQERRTAAAAAWDVCFLLPSFTHVCLAYSLSLNRIVTYVCVCTYVDTYQVSKGGWKMKKETEEVEDEVAWQALNTMVE